MKIARWVLLDTETTGFAAPIFTVEIAAQRMCGWEPQGHPFRRLLNQNQDIPPEASRVHGYTREILERDGEPAAAVYAALREYAGGLPLVSYHLAYDLDQVLKPEWLRLGIAPIGSAGFCALRLAQRLLDPVPAGNCKLQTLRQYYRLPERGAHTARGDVQTVADLMAHVLRPIAEERGLDTWEKVAGFSVEEWYPSRIAFGKHKGRSVWDARKDADLRGWLEWLSQSSNARSASMGRWYLRQIACAEPDRQQFFGPGWEDGTDIEAPPVSVTIVLYVNPDVRRLAMLVEAARARLAELEAAYTLEKAKVDSVQATLFNRLGDHYRKRDRFRLLVNFRRKFLESLLARGEEEAEQVRVEFQQADAQTARDYSEAATAMAAKRQLSPTETDEMRKLWRELVRLYHPDKFTNEPEKQASYEKLTAAINRAKDNGDMATLREIAKDPAEFILRQGWARLDFSDEQQVAQLRRLWESLELEIVSVLEATNVLRGSSEYELAQMIEKDASLLDRVANKQVSAIDAEVARLMSEAERLSREIVELTGSDFAENPQKMSPVDPF